MFSEYHPLVNFLYFALVLGFSMAFMRPACLAVSLAGAMAYMFCLRGGRALLRSLLYMLPMTLLAALANPLFNHAGGTILSYLPSGNPLTLESILYGAAAACLLAAALLWFSCCMAVMTTDKFVYLFGRAVPALSLLLSMILRFVPRFRAQFHAVQEAQRCLGRDVSSGKLLHRLRHAVTILSIVVTWSLENAVDTADSMKSRGYGLPGRTAFSVYRMDGRDRAALLWILSCGGYVFAGGLAGGMKWRYFPVMWGAEWNWLSGSFLLAYLLLCLTPVILCAWEGRKWIHLQSGT